MNSKELFNNLITLIKNLFTPGFIIRFNVSKTSKLMEVSSKSISCVLKCLVSSTYEATSFDHKMPSVECRSCEIFINGMNVKVFKWINGCGTVLPYISGNIIEITSLEMVNRIWREPIFHIDIT